MSGKGYRCSECDGKYTLVDEVERPVRMQKKILIAHPDRDLLSRTREMLEGAGFTAITVEDGIKALQLLEIESPDLVIVDVALPKYLGFEICNFIRSIDSMNDIKIILIASIYDKTRYKRLPTSLHGADDYIEIHHLWDMLIPKIKNLLGIESLTEEVSTETIQAIPIEDPAEGLGKRMVDGISQTEEASTASTKEELDPVKRLADIIVSDIILYNEELIEEGIRNGNLQEILKDDIEEGKRYLFKRFPDIPEDMGNDRILESFNGFVKKKRMEMGISDE